MLTLLLDNLLRDIRFTWRSFRRAPLMAGTIVVTVGLGLGLVAVVFTILNAFIFRPDDVRKPFELFAVGRQASAAAPPAVFTRQQYEALVRETDVFADAFASTSDVDARIEGGRREGRLVTGNFFHVLGVSAARGRTLTSADDQPGAPPAIVLSHRAWSSYFASDPSVVDRLVRVNGASSHVVGVMPESFRGLEVVTAPDFWAPLSRIDQFRSGQPIGEEATGVEIVGRLKPGLSRGQALAQLLVWDARHAAERSGVPTAKLSLEPKPGTIPLSTDTMLTFLPLFFAFGLILMIGCVNVANLLLARGVARQREIGIRLAMGASRRRVIRQLLIESLSLALLSATLAFAVSRLVLATVVNAVTSTFPPEIGNLRIEVPPADWRVAMFLVAGAMISTLFFALAPALQATRVELVRAIRGEVVRDARPVRARNALIALQVTGSVLLLICAAIFLRGSWAAARVDPGIRTEGIVNVKILNEQRRAAVLEAVRREPSVTAIAASGPDFPEGLAGLSAFADGAAGKSAVKYRFASPEYFGMLGIDVVRGRGFSQAERNPSAAVAVISDSVARQLWPGVDAIGHILRLEPDTDGQPPGTNAPLTSRTFVVVGVARDVTLRLLGVRVPGAGVYLPIGTETAGTSLTLSVHGDAERARMTLGERLAAIDPNMSEVSTLQIIARAEAFLLKIPFWLTLALGGLALVLTVSGLFSVLSYLVEQRTQEIGVRVALGATSRSIAVLVLVQSARPVAIGLLVGCSFTAALAAVLLASPAAEQIGSSVRLFDPVAYAAGLLSIVTACTCAALIPALRAAGIDPVGALRRD